MAFSAGFNFNKFFIFKLFKSLFVYISHDYMFKFNKFF